MMTWLLMLWVAQAPVEFDVEADAPAPFAWQLDLNGFMSGLVQAPVRASYNPHNQVLRLPSQQGSLQLRADLEVRYGEALRADMRPRLRAGVSRCQGTDTHSVEITASPYVNEAFVTWQPLPEVGVTYGLQNFQWGVADTWSPSNPLVPQMLLQLDPAYEFPGLHLARVNLSYTEHLSLVLLGELSRRSPGLKDPFEHKAVAKFEFSWDGGSSQLGVVGGVGGRARVGGYGNVALHPNVSVYFDAAYLRSTELAAAGAQGVAGSALALPGGHDLRVEFLFNGIALSAEQQRQRVAMLPSHLAAAPLDMSTLPGRKYIYIGLRIAPLGRHDAVTLHGRYLVSLGDGSGLASASLEWAGGDHWVFYASGALAHGERDAELLRHTHTVGLLGLRISA